MPRFSFETTFVLNAGAEEEARAVVSGIFHAGSPGDPWGRHGPVVAPELAEFEIERIQVMVDDKWTDYPLALLTREQATAIEEEAAVEYQEID